MSVASIDEGEPTPSSSAANPENGNHASWPAPPEMGTSAPAFTWAPPADPPTVERAEVIETADALGEALPIVWADSPAARWPGPTPDEGTEPATVATAASTNDEASAIPAAEIDDATTPDENTFETPTANARDRAAVLLDELRLTIAAITGDEPPRDLSGVIEELEIAVTPPGAIGADALADLRDALLDARDRPRDIDTMVALTGRLDEIVALVFAYDRSIAAIERSLAVLRGDE